ncbi:hypothetical protein ASE12_18500 [Aeromicrobium sp. Root236]|uniref:hypothetical protein n=1 Tax=Aeromicrobium sp. Root236 TaxID=1736498 RepID=UPI0007007C4C|nr:hypothetical protein [Aeromicrobium sp. Root236]KRC66586.1 hypothetical protein ASE12_18500 [Aeromicrobium sp. Root236]
MIAASVFLAQPAVADEGDAPAEPAVENTTDAPKEAADEAPAPETSEPQQEAPAETTPPAADPEPEPVVNDDPVAPVGDANEPADTPDDSTSGNAPNEDDTEGAAASAAAVDLEAKVTICHVPPGNPANAHAISVSYNSIVKGEGHGKNNAAHSQDWIPAFEYMDGDDVKQYPGRNTNAANPCGDAPGLTEVGTDDPTLVGPTCVADGFVQLPTSEGVTYTITPSNSPGDVDVDATANANYIIDDQATIHWDFLVLEKLAGDDPQCVLVDSTDLTICHRTDSNVNPYNAIGPATAGIVHGHDTEHEGPLWDPTLKAQHIEWGDIIPPYTFDNVEYPGQNWTAEGIAFYNDGKCDGAGIIPAEITADPPFADPADCDEDGSLVLPETDHVQYLVEPVFNGPGDYTITASVTDEEFVLVGQTVFEVAVGGKLPTADCVSPNDDEEPAKEDDLLPDTGGLPLWVLLLAGPMTAAGLLVLMRREPVSHASTSGRMPSYSLILPPVKKPAGIKRAHASTQHIGFMKAVGNVVAAIGSFLRGGRR